MKVPNELKIGLAVVLAGVVFYLGTRFLRDLPIFGQDTLYHTELTNSNGLARGNIVAVNGVAVGSVTEVQLVSAGVRIHFSVSDDVPLTEGTTASSGGFGFVSSIQLNLSLGPSDAPVYPPGSLIPASEQSDILGDIVDRAPEMISRLDTLLAGSSTAVGAATELLTNPSGQMKQTLTSIQDLSDAFQSVLLSEQGSLQSVLEDIENLSNAVETFTEDSLGNVAHDIRGVVDQLSVNLDILESTTGELNTLIASINDGQGTLGKLATEDSLYIEMRGAANAIKDLAEDFEENPRKYLESLKLIDIF